MYSSALANYRLIRSGKLPHGLRFWYRHSGEDHCDECVQLRVTRVTEDSSSYYVYVVAENKAEPPLPSARGRSHGAAADLLGKYSRSTT